MKIADFLKSEITQEIKLLSDGEECAICVRSTNSEEFATAKSSFEQSLAQLLGAGKELITKTVVLGQTVTTNTDDYEKLTSIMMASLIASWSFDDECDLENRATFLYNNKSVRAKVDEVATLIARNELKAKKKPLNRQKVSSGS